MRITRVTAERGGERDLSRDHADGCGAVPEGYQPDTLFKSGRVCAGTGISGGRPVPSCALCPHSPSYWDREADRPLPTEAEVDEIRASLPPAVERTAVEPLLDWGKDAEVLRKVRHHDGRLKPCRYCRKDTPLRDADGRPAHKVCAETRGQTNDDIAALGRYRKGPRPGA